MSKSMVRVASLMTVIAVLALVTEQAYAAEKGSITGNVIALDGKPAVGFMVKVVMDVPMTMGRPGKGKGTGGSGGGGTKTVAQATTDANGRFTFNNVEVGQYRLEGGNKNIGWLYEDVNVEANKTAEKKDVKLVKID